VECVCRDCVCRCRWEIQQLTAKHPCPSGLRGCTQVALYSYSWVRVPSDAVTFDFYSNHHHCHFHQYHHITSPPSLSHTHHYCHSSSSCPHQRYDDSTLQNVLPTLMLKCYCEQTDPFAILAYQHNRKKLDLMPMLMLIPISSPMNVLVKDQIHSSILSLLVLTLKNKSIYEYKKYHHIMNYKPPGV
jgi:hypothetical protein